IYYTEFLNGLLGRGGTLHAAGRIDEIRAVHRDFVAEGAHAPEGNLGCLVLGKRGAEAGAAGGNTGSEQREIGEEAPVDGQGLNLCGPDDLADLGLGRLNGLRLGGDDNAFALRSELERDVDCGGFADGENDAGLRVIREAAEGGF